MKSDDAIPPFDTSEIGTPLDYTEDLYKFYFELPDVDGSAERLLNSFLQHTGDSLLISPATPSSY